jgi:ribosomal protein S18 acetylase RimI-like enzyme
MMFIRTAGPNDLPAIRALLVETWHATYVGLYGAAKVTAITDDWHSLRALKAAGWTSRTPSSWWQTTGVAIAGMAFAGATEDGKTVTLSQLYVRPDRQGQGIGGMLLDEIIDSFPDAERIRLEVEPANARAIAFYSRAGLRRDRADGELRARTVRHPRADPGARVWLIGGRARVGAQPLLPEGARPCRRASARAARPLKGGRRPDSLGDARRFDLF